MMLPHEWRGLWSVVYCDPATMTASTLGSMALSGGSMALTGIGAGISAAGTLAGGDIANQAAQMKAAALRSEASLTAQQLTQNASTTRAVAQRQALDTRQQARYAEGSLTANAAGGGLSASGSTNVALTGQVASRGEYMALGEMASGENKARGMENEAAFTKYGAELNAEGALYQGEAAALGSKYSAAGTIASGLGSGLNMAGKLFFPTKTV